MKNTFRIVGGVVLVLALLMFFGISLGAASVSAQGPVPVPTPAQAPPAAAANPDDPARALKFGSAIQAIPAGGVQWYEFDYTTNGEAFPRPDVTVAMLNGATNGLQFEVYSPENIQGGWFNQAPIGRGTPFVVVDCTNSSDDTGHCATNDLSWRGSLGLDGQVFVRVLNFSNSSVAPQMIIAGPGLAACQNPTQKPAAAPATGANQPFATIQCGTPTVLPAAPSSTSGG